MKSYCSIWNSTQTRVNGFQPFSNLPAPAGSSSVIEFGNNGVAINDNGQVVFAGTRLDRSSGVFVVSLNGVLAIADKSTGIDHYLHPIINNAGDVAVFGYVKIDERRSRMGIYLIKDGTITQIGGDAYKMVSTTIHNVAAATGRVRNGVYLK